MNSQSQTSVIRNSWNAQRDACLGVFIYSGNWMIKIDRKKSCLFSKRHSERIEYSEVQILTQTCRMIP
jgi:hypothetical protein